MNYTFYHNKVLKQVEFFVDMKIGLDFDGVISDCGKLKSEGARRIYRVEILPERFKTELVVGAGILTLEQYRHLQKQIYENPDIGFAMLPVDGVFEFIPKLRQDNHNLVIITSRNEASCVIAKEWMRRQNISLELISVGGGSSKSDACRGLDVYIDDDLDKLEPLVGVVPNRYLFSWGYNKEIEVPENVAKRVESWSQFYREVSRLDGR